MSTLTINPPVTEDAPDHVGLRGSLRHIGAITRRYLIQIKNDPDQLVDVVLMPIIFLVMFTYVFGGAISQSTGDYLQFVLPGVIVMTAVMAGSTTGVGINTDISTGVMDRFRALPIARSAVLTGRLLSDMTRMLLCLVISLGFGVILGFRVQTHWINLLPTALLILAFSFALGWLFLIVGVSVKSPQSVQGLSVLIVLPLQFGSSMFAPPGTMPGWLQAFVKVNPMTHVTDASRALLNGGAVGSHLGWSLLWIVGIIAVAAPTAITLYRRKV